METTVEYSPWFSTVHGSVLAKAHAECMANFTEGDHAFKISFHKTMRKHLPCDLQYASYIYGHKLNTYYMSVLLNACSHTVSNDWITTLKASFMGRIGVISYF